MNQEDIPHQEPDETIDLKDFMDVVTTYKCKFCPFSCESKSGLLSHIRNTHITLCVQNSDNVDNKFTESKPKPLLDNLSTVPESIPTTNIPNGPTSIITMSIPATATQQDMFICGQCTKVFTTLEHCNEHVLKHCNVEIKDTEPKKTKKVNGKRKRCLNADRDKSLPPKEKETKRKVKTPKALEADYYLEPKKKPPPATSQTKLFRCTVKHCQVRFKSEPNVEYHVKCHLPDGKTFSCPECKDGKELSKHWRILATHLWKSHNIDVGLHSCPTCNYKTHSTFKLDNHRRIHSDERAFTCETCDKSFKQHSQLRNHKMTHKDRKDPDNEFWFNKQTCSICDRSFSDAKCLRKHLQAVHNKVKPYACQYCCHRSARKTMLELHLRQHTGEKPFACDLCDYKTSDHNSLRRHKMRHMGVKPYQCPHCSYACIQAISFKSHMKNKHPGLEGLFSCPYCPYRSVSKYNLDSHVGSHSNEEKQLAGKTSVKNAKRGKAKAADLVETCLNMTAPPPVVEDRTETVMIPIPNREMMEANGPFYLAIQPELQTLTVETDG